MTKTYTPHVYAEVIKAWADGKPIEWRYDSSESWSTVKNPLFLKDNQYRIKPEEVVDYTVVLPDGRPGVVFTSTIKCLSDYYSASSYQGYVRRTRLDGQVVSFEFIPK